MTESVGFGDAPVPRPDRASSDRARPDQARPDQARPDQARPDPARRNPARSEARSVPRVAVRYTLSGPPTEPSDRWAHRGPRRWLTVAAWLLLIVGAGLSGVVAVLMLSAWSAMLVEAAASSELVVVGGEHGLLLLVGTSLVLIAAVVKIWAFGAVVGSHREAPLLLGTMLAMDLVVWTIGELAGGVGVLGRTGVILIDVVVLAVLVPPWWRRRWQ